MPATAYIYTRMSSAEQLKGDSKRRQLASAFEYAKQRGLVPEIISDHGVSAFRGNNLVVGRLAQFHRDLTDGLVPQGSFLIVESLDRLSRDEVTHAISLFVSIVNAGITLVTLFDNQEYSSASLSANPMSIFVALISFATASEESKKKSVRLAAAWDQKKKLSRSIGKPLSRMVPAWLRFDESSGQIVAIPERSAVVAEIFRLCTSGWGALSITRLLNDRNEPLWTPSKNSLNAWHESYVKKILQNRAVLGEYKPHKNVYFEKHKSLSQPDGEPIKNYYPAVIDVVTFELAAEARRVRKVSGAGRKGQGFTNLFTGLLKCQCGAGIRYVNKGTSTKGGQYLVCSASKLSGRCNLPSIRYQFFEKTVLENLEGLDISSALGSDSTKSKQKALEDERTLLEIDLKASSQSQANLMAVLLAGEGPPPAILNHKFHELESAQLELKQRIELLSGDIKKLSLDDPESYRLMLAQLLSELRSIDTGNKEILRRSVSAELRKMVKHIRIGFESLEFDEDSVGQSQEFMHVAHIQYQRSLTQVVPLSTSSRLHGIKFRWSPEHDLLKARVSG